MTTIRHRLNVIEIAHPGKNSFYLQLQEAKDFISSLQKACDDLEDSLRSRDEFLINLTSVGESLRAGSRFEAIEKLRRALINAKGNLGVVEAKAIIDTFATPLNK